MMIDFRNKYLKLPALLGLYFLLSSVGYADCKVNKPSPCSDSEDGVTCGYLDYDCSEDASYSFDWTVDGVDLGTWDFDFGKVEVSGNDFAGYVYQDPDNPSCVFFKLDTEKVTFSIDGSNYSFDNLSSDWCQYNFTSGAVSCPIEAVDFFASLQGYYVDNTVSLSASLAPDNPPFTMGLSWLIGFKLSACGYSTYVSWTVPLTKGNFSAFMKSNQWRDYNEGASCSPPS